LLTIVQATGGEHQEAVRELFSEYLNAVCPVCNREYGTTFDPATMLPDDMAHLEAFEPPAGRLLLAYEGSEAAGVACVRTIGERIAEIKRMYVRSAFRRVGVGRTLVDAAVAEMRSAGYAALRLDSAGFMADAHSLYRAAGFREIASYPESEVPASFHRHWVFMELPLRT
jgi:ribosomal protein S18 acetylase RimI-like enzyme